jgi:hypothetical protein
MIKKIRQGTNTVDRFIPPETSGSVAGAAKARGAAGSPESQAELVPYSARDLKYMWSMWEEAHRHQAAGLRYRNIYAGSLGLIVLGWLGHRLGSPFSAPLGSLLMLVGGCLGIWFCLKSLRGKDQSPREG